MFTLHVTTFEFHSSYLNDELRARTGNENAFAPGGWPSDRLVCARSCSLEILADAAKPALDWCWS